MSDDNLDGIIPPSPEVAGEETRRKMIPRWEAALRVRGVSLTEQDANTGFRVALEMADLLVQGMHATGGIDAEQMNSLRWWIGTGIDAADEFGS